MYVPDWPVCATCREWVAGACTYERRTPRRWRHPAAQEGPLSLCGYWHSRDGETRRDRCKLVNAALDDTRPPLE